MKHAWRSVPAIVAAALAASLLIAQPGYASTAVTLAPVSYATLAGSDGGQDAAALASSDLTGTDQNAADVLTLTTPGSARYKGYRVFNLPAEVSPSTITAIQAHINYYGPARKHQSWTWSLYSWPKGRWVKVGNSKDAVENQWSALTLNLKAKAGTFGTFVGPTTHTMLLMVQSNNARYDAQLDFEALVVTSRADVTVTPPPAWTPPPAHAIWSPTPGTTWQWQLNQPVNTSYNVQMYDVDLFETPQATIDQLHTDGRTVICYFSAGSVEDWRPDAKQFPKIAIGKKLVGWAGEKWLDVRQIAAIGPIMRARLDKAVARHCDGVEADNVDAYTNKSGFPLTYQNQLAFNTWLAGEAHARYLSIGLKNDLDQIPDLVDDFDWALNEQCYEYHECGLLQPFVSANKAVFGVEYNTNPAVFCPQANAAGYSFMKKHLDLDAWMQPCW